MLFTRCPGCQTTFRISADTLRVANGAVRCGSCATVFSAFSGLRQDTLSEDTQQGDEFLSPTLQTQELAGIEEIASPDVEGQSESAEAANEIAVEDADARDFAEAAHELEDTAESGSTDAAHELEDAGEMLGMETPPEEALGDPKPTRAKSKASRAQSKAPPTPPSGNKSAPTEEAAVESPQAHENSDKLHFDAPVDEWTVLLSEIEKSVEGKSEDSGENAEASSSSDLDVDAPARSPSVDAEDDADLWDIGEPFSLEAWGDDSPERPQQAEQARRRSESAEQASDNAHVEHLSLDEAISAEEIDATLSSEPDPELIAAFESSLGQSPDSDAKSRRWALGCAGLLLVLGLQIVHHFRGPLATQPVIGSLVRGSYSLLGVQLVPGWDLEQYEITNWAATAGAGSGGAGNLHITAQIRNGGPKAQPYPSIQLELKDRWEAVIGSRIFLPREYLAADLDSAELMAAGTTVPADLQIVDPGLDASGFELDVCLEIDGGRVTCAADQVFQ